MKKPVLVLGGGIAGIQASLDLAEMGIPVFIIEKTPSIGGRMAQLDKTFPTNDCSACILAPKVTSCYNHPLIKTLTCSELLEIRGEAPDFTAVVKKNARFIDEENCKGCNDCTVKCPIIKENQFDMGLGKRHAVYKPFAQAVPNKVTIEKKGTSPCKFKCPAHMDAHGYIALAAEGRYEEALGVIRRVTPFAGVLGRVCLHTCENSCSRQYVDEPVSIAGIKRFLADYELSSGKIPSVKLGVSVKQERIAIAGSGPAGLNCAYTLAKEGYKVTVFEALPVPGGMLKVGIPDYRLDKAILTGEINILREMGVEIITGKALGRDFTAESLRNEGFCALFLAIGAHKDMKLGIPGENHPGVISSVRFLRQVNLGQNPAIGKKVLVVGGGNVAMDAARTAIRLGCDVTIVYRRTAQDMPANSWEIEHAREEGIGFMYLTTPVEVLTSGPSVIGMACLKNMQGAQDASGRRRPEPIPDSDFIIEADTIITAIGQTVDDEFLLSENEKSTISFNKKGYISCDNDTLQTETPWIFAGGDAVLGPATMIEAIAHGNMAAKSIINYLEGTNLPVKPFMLPETPVENIDFGSARPNKRASIPLIGINARIKTFGEVETGFDEATAKNEASRCIDCSICSECHVCEETCKSGAICHNQQDEMLELDVSSVILANGYDTSSSIPSEYGYGRYKDVVTGMQYERMLSASGPFQGHVQRPSDGKAPHNIAFIQCVGSRDNRCDSDYCSAVCCMYAVKEAIITKEHLPSVKNIDIYYMDMRAYGKDFDKYVEQAEVKHKIRFIRSRAGGIARNEENGKLLLHYSDYISAGNISESGEKLIEYRNEGCNGDHAKSQIESRNKYLNEGRMSAEYDLIVLSTGLKPSSGSSKLFQDAGIKTDQFGFCWTNEMNPPQTSVKGILACGASAGPKDIPETVLEASAAAAEASAVASATITDISLYKRFFKEEAEPETRDVSKEPVRVGVFVCHCGINIGGYLSVSQVVEHAKKLPHVVFAEEYLYSCSIDSQKVIADRIKEYGINRVVVASCTPRTHEPLFQGVLQKAGLNPYLFTMANIRDQCSWVHMDQYKEATEKAKDLVKMAVGKAIYSRQLTRQKIEVNKSTLVIGGGMAGMSAALELAGMGFFVYLAEKSNTLGGNARQLSTSVSGRPIKPYVEDYIHRVENNPLIKVLLNARIERIDGYVGNFSTILRSINNEFEPVIISHGAVIVATGAHEQKPSDYLYGKNPAVLTQLELEDRLEKRMSSSDPNSKEFPDSIFMIQCASSRNSDTPYCSRVCCNQAVKNALRIRQKQPDTKITILYRDIRTYGMNELQYKRARKSGIRFVHYETANAPFISENDDGSLAVSFFDGVVNKRISENAGMLVLAGAVKPDADENRKLGQMLKVPVNQDGFFLEAHVKLRPVDFATEGVFLCGLAHSPRNLRESITQGKAAAARAATIVSKDMLETEGTVARTDDTYCSGCGACEMVCAYKAITIEDIKKRDGTIRKARINAVLCKGCGTCSAVCRCGAIDVNGFSDRQVLNEIDFLMQQ